MTEIEDDYLVTDDPSVAVLFWGKEVGFKDRFSDWDAEAWSTWTWIISNMASAGSAKIRIPRALVREAIEPIEGGFYFAKDYKPYQMEWKDSEDPVYRSAPTTSQNSGFHYVADNAITTGKNTGELRKLVEWARGSDDRN